MLKLIHTADVHLGARHDDLGEQAAAQRERQFAAFRATVDLAIAEKVDVMLIAGDLFDSNVQPRRSVERVAAELKRMADAKIRTVIIPGTHDVYDRASIYRAYDLASMAGSGPDNDMVTVLDPERPWIHLAVVRSDRRSPGLRDQTRAAQPARRDPGRADMPVAGWHVGMVHGSIAIPGRTDRDEVVVTTDEIAGSGLDYLALGHWHSAQNGKAGAVTYAYSGAPEAVALDQDRAGKALLVELEEVGAGRSVKVEERQVGRTRFEKMTIDTATLKTQQALIVSLAKRSDPDLVLDVRLNGVRPDELDFDTDEIETALAPGFLKVRVRDVLGPRTDRGPLPSPDTIAGAFIRDLEARIARARGVRLDRTKPPRPRDALRLGRLLLGGREVSV